MASNDVEVLVRSYVVPICDLCRDATGAECHVPGCLYCLSDVPERPLDPSQAIEVRRREDGSWDEERP